MSYVNLLEIIYPIGSIYISCNDTSPAEIVGGTWSMVSDAYFLMASNTARAAGSTGGANSITLTTNQIPSHSHSTTGLVGWPTMNTGWGWRDWNGGISPCPAEVKTTNAAGGGKPTPIFHYTMLSEYGEELPSIRGDF